MKCPALSGWPVAAPYFTLCVGLTPQKLKEPEMIEEISKEEWALALDAHLAWASSWHGDLPADSFFGVWGHIIKQTAPLVVNVQLDTPQPVSTTPADSPLIVENNRVLLDDGRELVLQFSHDI